MCKAKVWKYAEKWWHDWHWPFPLTIQIGEHRRILPGVCSTEKIWEYEITRFYSVQDDKWYFKNIMIHCTRWLNCLVEKGHQYKELTFCLQHRDVYGIMVEHVCFYWTTERKQGRWEIEKLLWKHGCSHASGCVSFHEIQCGHCFQFPLATNTRHIYCASVMLHTLWKIELLNRLQVIESSWL